MKPEHVFVAGLIVAFVVWLIRLLWALWEENRDKRLSDAIESRLKNYVTKEELDMRFDDLREHTDSRFDGIQKDGNIREGRILGTLQASSEDRRRDMEEIRNSIGAVHQRVDRVLELSGERRGK